MEIRTLVNHNYYSVSILEDMEQIAEWLKQQDYYAIIDEERRTTGIITARDFIQHPNQQVIDHDTTKPRIRPDQTIPEVFELMKSSQSVYLPVFEDEKFLGVISLWTLTERLLKLIEQYKRQLS